jgi:hypothetical protein
MRHALIASLLLLAACASATQDDAPVSPPPAILIEQTYGPSNIPYSRGTTSIIGEYAISVQNPADVPITLRRVDLQSVGGATIAMRREDRSFDVTVNPGSVETVKLSPRIYFTSTGSNSPTNEPMTVRAVIHFESPKGAFRRIITKTISQFPQ